MKTRRATPEDAAAIARIYNEGIAERIATFETESRTEAQVRAWFALEPARLLRAKLRVGTLERHGTLGDRQLDVVVVEKLL